MTAVEDQVREEGEVIARRGKVERTSQVRVSSAVLLERTAEEESRGKRAWFQADGLRPE